MGTREALYAGTTELSSPMAKATLRLMSNTEGGIESPLNMIGMFDKTLQKAKAKAQPKSPPIMAMITASEMIIVKTFPVVNPRVFKTPISLILSRTDIAMVFADTSRIVNTTAPQMLSRKSFTLPNMETKLS